MGGQTDQRQAGRRRGRLAGAAVTRASQQLDTAHQGTAKVAPVRFTKVPRGASTHTVAAARAGGRRVRVWRGLRAGSMMGQAPAARVRLWLLQAGSSQREGRTCSGRVVAQGAGCALKVAGVLGAGARRALDARRLPSTGLILVHLHPSKEWACVLSLHVALHSASALFKHGATPLHIAVAGRRGWCVPCRAGSCCRLLACWCRCPPCCPACSAQGRCRGGGRARWCQPVSGPLSSATNSACRQA